MITVSLIDLDDPTIFKHGLLWCVHPGCSPWTSQEIEAAYANSPIYSQVISSSIPKIKNLQHPKCVDCFVCTQKFGDLEMTMLIPVSQDTFIDYRNRKLQTGDTCRCPDLLKGHSQGCIFSL